MVTRAPIENETTRCCMFIVLLLCAMGDENDAQVHRALREIRLKSG